MVVVIFIVAWIGLLITFVATKGKVDMHSGSPSGYVGLLLIIVVFGCALYVMSTGNVRGGIAMLGSLVFFAVGKKKEKD